jgi:ribonuclease P protein component
VEGAPFFPDVAARGASGCRSEVRHTHQRFPRSFRLTARRSFVETYNRGRRARRASFTLFALENGLGRSRLGLTVPRRVGGAVQRNRVKRVLRDIFRRRRAELPGSFDIVLNAQPSIVDLPARQLEAQFVEAMAELGRKAGR